MGTKVLCLISTTQAKKWKDSMMSKLDINKNNKNVTKSTTTHYDTFGIQAF